MSITKYSQQDISKLTERLQRIEQGIKNLKMERKVYFSDAIRGAEWTDWTPDFSENTIMTFTDVTVSVAQYCVIDKIVFFNIRFYGTTGGTARQYLLFTVPIDYDISNGLNFGGGCIADDPSFISGFWYFYYFTNYKTVMVRRYDNANWNLGAGTGATVQGFYRID